MKRALRSLLAAVCLELVLASGALALDIRLSDQGVTVDGEPVRIRAYNIDGSNYFRLRDVAALLSGTPAAFSVSYLKTSNTVSIRRGYDYLPLGGELDTEGPDESGTAVASVQTMKIDGQTLEGLSVYNIGGSNYFRLRELGEILGFGVDYDEETRTVCIRTSPGLPADWDPAIRFSSTDAGGEEWTEACFCGKRLTLVVYWAPWSEECDLALPVLQDLADSLGDEGLQVLCLHDEDKEEESLAILRQLGVSLPSLRYDYAFDSYLNTGYVPAALLVDGDGKIVGDTLVGSRSREEWLALLEPLLAGTEDG